MVHLSGQMDEIRELAKEEEATSPSRKKPGLYAYTYIHTYIHAYICMCIPTVTVKLPYMDQPH